MATVVEIKKNEATNFTMKEVKTADAVSKGLYINLKLNDVVYSVDKKLLFDNIDNDEFNFKVSKNGLWLVDSALSFTHDRTM